MEAQHSPAQLQALIIPLKNWNLIVPQSLVAEILPMPEVRLTGASESWLRGSIEWRGTELPLVSIDGYCSPETDDEKLRTRRVAVLQNLGESCEHYALEIYSIPHPLRVVESDVIINDDPNGHTCELIARHVQVSGVKGIILEFDLLEKKISEVVG
jgi:chemotaxis signal transduction protein